MSTAGEVFIFGLANSLHCAGMCGPLACCTPGGRSALAYHAGRVASYATLGAGAGALGGVVAPDLELATGWLSVAMALALLATVLGAPRILRTGGGATLTAAFRRLHRASPLRRGLGLGLLTPLLPCSVLWIAGGMALVSGSGSAGALTMSSFAVGAVPALLLVQLNFDVLQRRLGADGRRRLFRSMMLVASAVLLWRGVAELTGGGGCH